MKVPCGALPSCTFTGPLPAEPDMATAAYCTVVSTQSVLTRTGVGRWQPATPSALAARVYFSPALYVQQKRLGLGTTVSTTVRGVAYWALGLCCAPAAPQALLDAAKCRSCMARAGLGALDVETLPGMRIVEHPDRCQASPQLRASGSRTDDSIGCCQLRGVTPMRQVCHPDLLCL